jgi:hypothetical protein
VVSLSFKSLPITLRYLLPLALLAGLAYAGVRWGIRAWENSHARLAVVDTDGAPLQEAQLEFFVYDESPWAPSPTPLLATLELGGPDVMTLDWDQVPGEALVRVRAPEYGIAFGYLESGGDVGEVRMGSPVPVEGRVLTASGRPVSDASIVGLGGGPRGVPLAETVSGADGRFRLEDISGSISNVMLRVRKEGYAILHEKMWRRTERDRDLRLERTFPVVGKIEGFPGSDYSALRILVYKLPGVETRVLSDGTFYLDHLPPKTHVQLLVHGLAPGYTHRGARGTAGGEDLAIQVTRSASLRGQAIFAETEYPAAGAIIYHENGPSGRPLVTADSSGWFSLDDLPAGEVWLYASGRFREVAIVDGVRKTEWVDRSGSRSVLVEEGQDLNGIEILIY